MEKQYNLTEGIIWKKMIIFFLPILAGNLFQQLYTVVDAVIIGQFAGKDALASIDAIYSLIKLPVNFFVGLSTGATIIISQYLGAGDSRKLSIAVHTAVAFAFTGGLILSVGGILLSPICLHLLKVPNDIYAYTLSYARIYFAGMVMSMTYNIGAGILRAVGDSKTPFYFLVAASATNVLLDLLFVGLFQWHTAGAAFATVLSQLLSVVLVIGALRRTRLPCRIEWKNIRFHRGALHRIFLLGLPGGIQSSLYPVANMMIQSNINSFGINSIAAWAICGKLDFLIWLIVDSFGAAISTFTAQNFGARLYGRIRSGARVCIGMSLVPVLAIAAVLYLACAPLGRLFVNDPEVIELSASIMRFLAPLYVLYIAGEVLSGTIRGTGETFKPMLLTLLGTCACRIFWILFVVPLRRTLKMVILSYPVSWIITSILFIVFYQIYKRKKLSLQCPAT
ncbi:MAG: MATE family efflux transporter [Treponema sp.]|jgi:putative MATE family efflux protein|nr:MATE family efflux transporter [Treponema sp.]